LAYRVVEPIVNARRGVLVTVTVSEKGAVKVSDWPGIKVAFDGPVRAAEIVGAVRSIVIGVVVSVFAVGPLAPEFTARMEPASI
jgi:hypothetical protein